MKKAWTPILWALAAVLLLIVAAYVYESKWGINGPFKSEHHH